MCYLPVHLYLIIVFLCSWVWPTNWLLLLCPRLQDCPLCRVSLPDTEIRKPLKVSGLADYLGIPEDSMASAIREARVNANSVEDGDDEIL